MKLINLRMLPEHLPTLAQWHHQEWQHLNPGYSLSDRIEDMQNHLNNDFIPSTFIALHENVLLGSAAIIENDMDTRSNLTPWLASVYVPREQRGKGIGKKLVQHTVTRARNNGISKLYLFTEDLASYYRRLGWTEDETTQYRGKTVHIMSVDLNTCTDGNP